MVSVVFAMCPSLTRMRATGKGRLPTNWATNEQATCQFCGRAVPPWRRYCIAPDAGADVNDVSGLSEPHGPDRAMADGGIKRAEISQSGAAGRIGPHVRTACRSTGI